MYKKVFLGVFWLFYAGLITAQTDFLKDPDIVWAAEIEQDWVVDIPSLEEEWDNGLITLKQFRSQENELGWSSPYLAELVFEAVKNGELPIFKDPDFKQIEDDLMYFHQPEDTFVVFDPITFESKVLDMGNHLDLLKSIKAWRLKQILSYHKKKATWSITTLAVAPLIEVRDWDIDSTVLKPLYWFKTGQKRPKLTSKNIVWAKKTFTQKLPEAETSGKAPVLLKTMKEGESPILHLLQVFEQDMKSPFYNSQGKVLLSPIERKNMLEKRDTMVIFNPETYEETILIGMKGINPSEFAQLRLVQTWYWDARRKRLSVFLDAVAPIKNVIDYRGRFWYASPLFYRRAKR